MLCSCTPYRKPRKQRVLGAYGKYLWAHWLLKFPTLETNDFPDLKLQSLWSEPPGQYARGTFVVTRTLLPWGWHCCLGPRGPRGPRWPMGSAKSPRPRAGKREHLPRTGGSNRSSGHGYLRRSSDGAGLLETSWSRRHRKHRPWGRCPRVRDGFDLHHRLGSRVSTLGHVAKLSQQAPVRPL